MRRSSPLLFILLSVALASGTAKAGPFTSAALDRLYPLAILFEEMWSDPLFIEFEDEMRSQYQRFNASRNSRGTLVNFDMINELRRQVELKYEQRFSKIASDYRPVSPGESYYPRNSADEIQARFQLSHNLTVLLELEFYSEISQLTRRDIDGDIYFRPHKSRVIDSLKFLAWNAYADLMREIIKSKEYEELSELEQSKNQQRYSELLKILNQESVESMLKMSAIFRIAYDGESAPDVVLAMRAIADHSRKDPLHALVGRLLWKVQQQYNLCAAAVNP